MCIVEHLSPLCVLVSMICERECNQLISIFKAKYLSSISLLYSIRFLLAKIILFYLELRGSRH